MAALRPSLSFLLLFFFSSPFVFAADSIKDSRGKVFKAPQKTPRLVSGFVGADEILVELLGDEPEAILSLSPLAKDERYSAVAEAAKRWPNDFGSELETLIGKKPDLVIVASYTRVEWLRILDQAGIPTFVLGKFSTLEDIRSIVSQLGFLSHRQKKAADILENMDRRLNRLKSECPLKGRRVVNYSKDGTIFGAETSFHSMISFLGAINAGANIGVKGWAKVSQESQIKLKPDLIVSSDEKSKADILKEISQDPIWNGFAAVKNGSIARVSGKYLSSVSHHVVKAMEAICAQAK